MTFLLRVLCLCVVLVSSSFADTPKKVSYNTIIENNAGYVVYLDFWASWCVPCRRSFPWMNELQKKYKNDNFRVVSINLDANKALAEQFLEKTPANFSILYDPKGHLAKEMRLKGMPSSFIISAEGKLVSAHVGFTDKKKARYEQEIQQLLKGE